MSEKTIQSEADLKEILDQIKFVNSALDFKWKFHIAPLNNYAPGWLGMSEFSKIELIGWFVKCSFERPDCNTGKIGIGYGREEFIRMGTTVSGAVKTAWLLIELLIRHELLEGFTWNGARIFNPHNSVYELAALDGNNLRGRDE